MRNIVKGGHWKNTEDEVLKAAVMKYGKNQWARVASLLNRKSPKQCKARWYEWLDPSIKKTEWTREEEEKLLHLAKIFPTQWRTIAPIVGRTATQCLEHYEKLLDRAQNIEKDLDETDDPRRLRPGEIDPNPESKPAKPDAIDLDEDEKEMLSEARARLANTKGKKAKRKARERQLEEARRIAALQKKRELKAAGIFQDLTEKKKKKLKGQIVLDYNKVIPLQKSPLPGFYDINEEKALSKGMSLSFEGKTIEEMEGKKKSVEEEKLRKEDIEKAKRKRKEVLPQLIKQIDKINKGEQYQKKVKLSLPSPQVDDNQLEEVGKILAKENNEIDTEQVTSKLITNFKSTPQISSSRTPAIGVDTIKEGAKNLIMLTKQQTPLIGGSNPELTETFKDFQGIKPSKSVTQTPNVFIEKTPSRTVMSTPREFTSLKEERERQEMLKRELKESIESLPKPQHDKYFFKLSKPKKLELDEMTEDQEDTEERQRKEDYDKEQISLKKRSLVYQKKLPIPKNFTPEKSKDEILNMIESEMKLLIDYDNGKVKNIEEFKITEINNARSILEKENFDFQHFVPLNFSELWDECYQEIKIQYDVPQIPSQIEKLESKLKLLTNGYVHRESKLNEEVQKVQSEIYDLKLQLETYQYIYKNELQAIPKRIETLKEEIQFEKEREAKLQKEYYDRMKINQ